MSTDPIPGSPVPNQFIITLHASADFDVHVAALLDVIKAANASGVKSDKPYVVSRITLNVKVATGLPLYGGIFSESVLQWIKDQEAVERVAANVYSELD